ncbi:MAG: DUF2892 domain-containing protein [Dehalococcoidales bacterium]|jgi:hypothetical protein|nr:DUF2892 domain-containing protein [Dehalococcoidales bacterium]MDD3265387.1 DUF2892 domain-containing protein [Dehalococcoidales bacterium]MDD4322862.1 DUF2892 domain-containing protein [Dehalococcoidales bacterium]MDD4794260.1 DUF2892 domain-containing protein [Dehalococcoidales bacterium]MDD5498811.1 DUF2892 domain-containing protein [Dehalococcoidales bacterium]
MKLNMGTADRTIRAILGIAALVIALFFVAGVWDIVLYIFGAIMVITAALGVCPLYIPFNISTR